LFVRSKVKRGFAIAEPLFFAHLTKKVPPLRAELFLFEKTGCLLQFVEMREAHLKSRQIRLNPCCNSFTTPTRLADGLGKKKYPRVSFSKTLRPVF